ncbi:MAG: threonine ammonia-lyase [Deltaproteobacteria bacterium]|nr:threonine ammonia-lyase [Deltaproteobacteria bacterium]
MTVQSDQIPHVSRIQEVAVKLKGLVTHTPLQHNRNLSERYGARIALKREDLQVVRSYKLRGAYNKISSLSNEEKEAGVVCASAGNHAQGVAYSCDKMGISGLIYMPSTTSGQKIRQVELFGKKMIEVILTGDTFDDANKAALEHAKTSARSFIPPFDDPQVIEGQGTVGVEILSDAEAPVDYLFVPIGGGGLASGIGSYFKQVSPQTKIIGVEPAGAKSMTHSLAEGRVVSLDTLDEFVDGAAVRRVGDLTFDICRRVVDDVMTVPEGKVCTTILTLYNEEAIVVEPAGALAIAALDSVAEEIIGKNVVCVVSGGNNDITRTEEIKERSLLYEGIKHYFIIRFPQRAGALREFLVEVLGPSDDITYFDYKKKNNRDKGPVLIGIELKQSGDFGGLIERMKDKGIYYEYLNDKPDLFQYII